MQGYPEGCVVILQILRASPELGCQTPMAASLTGHRIAVQKHAEYEVVSLGPTVSCTVLSSSNRTNRQMLSTMMSEV
jgi:hypothetical protein